MATVRPATPEDVAHLHDMIVELAIYEKEPDAVVATEQDLMKALFGGTAMSNESAATPTGAPALYAHVIDDPDGGLAAMAIWFLSYSTWEGTHGVYLEDLFVREQHRGKGFGRALMESLARVCTDHGYTRFQWWVLDWNTPAIEVYRRLGAVAMDEWTIYRLTDEPLRVLGSAKD